MSMPNHLPGNPYERLLLSGESGSNLEPEDVVAFATLALAWEQRQRNILAYRTATNRGIPLGGLDHLNASKGRSDG